MPSTIKNHQLQFSNIIFERKVRSILQNILPTRIAEYNISFISSSMKLPTNITVNVGAPIIDWEGIDNTADNSPLISVSQDRSIFAYNDAMSIRDEQSIYRLMVYIPDAETGINNTWDQARIICRIAANLIETYAVDAADDNTGSCFRIDILDQQPSVLQKGHGTMCVISFRADLRNSYFYDPWISDVLTNIAPSWASYLKQDSITYSFEDDIEITASTNAPIVITTSLSDITLTPIKIYNNVDWSYSILQETGKEVGFTTATPPAPSDGLNLNLGGVQDTWNTLNSGQYVTIYCSLWDTPTNRMWFFEIRLTKA
jgi:hypothetical protein